MNIILMFFSHEYNFEMKEARPKKSANYMIPLIFFGLTYFYSFLIKSIYLRYITNPSSHIVMCV